MPKILKVKIGRQETAAKTHYQYPTVVAGQYAELKTAPCVYDPTKISVIVYETSDAQVGKLADVQARGNDHEFLIGVVKDIDAPAFLASPDIVELTRDEAIALGDTWTMSKERITDQTLVTSLLAKQARKETLTAEEIKSLDPNDPSPGLGMTPTFAEELDATVAHPKHA